MQNIKYKRVLLKLSGEALMGKTNNIFDKVIVNNILDQIKQLTELNIKIGIVLGAGNIFRGIEGEAFNLQKTNADYMGILATIINGIAFKDFLINVGIRSKCYSALEVTGITKGYNRDSMLSRLNDGNVIIFVGGSGLPYFTTDTAAAIRAIDMKADLIIKATNVDGVYETDPKFDPQAKKYLKLSFDEAISKNLKIMDMAAFDLCRTNKINIQVCNIFKPNCLKDIIYGDNGGTLVYT